MKKRTKIIVAIVLALLLVTAAVDFYHQTHPAPQVVPAKNPNFPEF